MAKSLDAELAAIAAEERKLAERRQAHQAKVREAAVGAVEKAGLFKVPLDRLEGLMKAVKTLGVDHGNGDGRGWDRGAAVLRLAGKKREAPAGRLGVPMGR